MINQSDIDCLSNLDITENHLIDPEPLKQEIRNYGNFYHLEYHVPKKEIFYAAAVPGSKLLKICENPTVKIYIAKTSDDNGNISDFKFIIVGADVDGQSKLDDPDKVLVNDNYIARVCCKNPPPDATNYGLEATAVESSGIA